MSAMSRSAAEARAQTVDTTPREAFHAAVHALASAAALIVLSPLILAIAVGIKLTSPGSVFYRGARVGRGGRIFTIYKFRTLVEGAEQKIGARLLNDGDRQSLFTPIGRYLKKSKLDELPQLWNVLRGDMRLVGPRPIRPIFLDDAERTIPGYADRFRVAPGVTGIAQVRGGYYTTPRNKLRYDRIYIDNRSLALDAKVVLFTVVKILDRWIPAGMVLLFLLLFVSFVPVEVRAALDVPIHGWRVDLVYVFILLAALRALAAENIVRFTLRRSPLNLAVVAFVALGLASAPFTDDPWGYFYGVGYYVVTGFLVAFLLVNTFATDAVATLVVRAIALTSVLMSLLGLGQLLLASGGVAIAAEAGEAARATVRIDALLGSPMLLAVYLVLGIPLLLCEVERARTQPERDFWLVCATISVVGIVFTQTRVGLAALLVTGTVFLSRRLPHALFFATLFLFGVMVLAVAGVGRFSPQRIAGEVEQWIDRQAPVLSAVPARDWLIGGGPRRAFWIEGEMEPRPDQPARPVPNMHITFAWEHGIGLWLITMGVIGAALRTMKRAHDTIVDEDRRIQIWAILSGIIGFLVSMNGINAFHNLPLQIFFWSLIGIGLETVHRATRPKRSHLIWRFGDAGD